MNILQTQPQPQRASYKGLKQSIESMKEGESAYCDSEKELRCALTHLRHLGFKYVSGHEKGTGKPFFTKLNKK